MFTLYDLIGARPGDDAEGLKKAFRNAVKATHPDINPDDPNAVHRFRQIVRAHSILSDEESRAAYDRLLDFEIRGVRPRAKRGIVADTIHKIVTDVVAIGVVAVVLLAGYALLKHTSLLPVTVQTTAVALAREPVNAVVVTPAAPPAATAIEEPAERSVAPKNDDEPIEPSAADLAIGPSAADLAAIDGGREEVTGAIGSPTPVVRDARFYREKGIAAYRDGDLLQALVDLDIAIRLDPQFREAYIDRGIVFYRMGNFDRAYADIARANGMPPSLRAKRSQARSHTRLAFSRR